MGTKCCSTAPARIVLITGDAALAGRVLEACQEYGHELHTLSDIAGLPQVPYQPTYPELVLFDTRTSDSWSGARSAASAAATTHAGLVFFVGAEAPEIAVMPLWSLGADDVLPASLDGENVGARLCVALRHRRRAAPRGADKGRLPITRPGRGEHYVSMQSVCYIEAARDASSVMECCRLHECGLSLNEVEPLLPASFLRVHRSFIVNLDHVVGSEWINRWTWVLVIDNPVRSTVPVSRAMISEVRARLGR